MSLLRNIFSRKPASDLTPTAPPRTLPPGQRIYAIGDIHGRLDLLDALLKRIDADDAARPPVDTNLIFLGDLIDRGPDSRGVVERVKWLMQASPNVRCVIGNHEDLLLRCIDGDARAIPVFGKAGGHATLISYGAEDFDYDETDTDEIVALLQTHIPQDHVDFLKGLDDCIVIGGYLFVHAGIKPGVAMDEQKPEDMRWIRERFTGHSGDHGVMVVHGHTITEFVDLQSNRIGIDTGAYATGKLTAVGLEGTDFWFLDTGGGVQSQTANG